MPSPVEIRAATVEDAAALVPLLAELGYTVSDDLMRDNIRRLSNGTTDQVWVAESGGDILGIVSVHLTPLFHAPGHVGRITSLAVTAPSRGQGIGGKLISTAEAFCWDAGCARIELTSGNHRHGAHRFYERLGFQVQSRHFLKHR